MKQKSINAFRNILVRYSQRYYPNFRATCMLLLLTGQLFMLQFCNKAPSLPASNAQLFVENLDKFPSDRIFVAARIHIPWSRDSINYNANHDTLLIRLHNKGTDTLLISKLTLSDDRNWHLVSLGGTTFDAATSLPLVITSGSFADLKVNFLPPHSDNRVKLIVDELVIASNDDKQPNQSLTLQGLFQRMGEGNNEPQAQEIINLFGFTSNTDYSSVDPDKGANNKPKGDQVLASYFVRADTSKPVYVRQMAAYHGCCTQPESLRWYPKGNTSALSVAVFHTASDAQTLLPRRSGISNSPAEGSFSPSGPFGLKVGSHDWSDTLLNPKRQLGIRVWKVIDGNGHRIRNAFIIANDYLGTEATNYDYNDNMYYITNIRTESGE